MLSCFCRHSYQNEVLGGLHLSITAGLQLFRSLWPGFNSRAYKLSLNSIEQGPFNPLLSLSPDKCSSAASPRHMPPSYLLLCAIRWPALQSRMDRCELLYLHIQHQAGLCRTHDLCPNCWTVFPSYYFFFTLLCTIYPLFS